MTVRILLVSGDETARAPVAEALRSMPWVSAPAEIAEAATGEQALSQAAAEPFDLAVAELVLPRPGISGAYALIRVRELCPRCRTLLVSDHDYVSEMVGGAADLFLPRGSGTGERELRAAVKELLPERMGDELATQALAVSEADILPATRAPVDSLPAEPIAGRYRPVADLGQAVGPVYRTEDLEAGSQVVVQLLPLAAASAEEEGTLRIRRTLSTARRLKHPNIVGIQDAGFDGEHIYVVTELVGGSPLRDVLAERGALPRQEALDITFSVLEALGHAHDLGLMHGDLKPANILLTPAGDVRVADFGLGNLFTLADVGEGDQASMGMQPSTDGTVLASVGYMAPEQIQGRSFDHRVDLYALGAVLFEMLHGKALSRFVSPFVRAAFLDVDREPHKLPELPGDRRLSEVLEEALAPSLKRRYASCEDFAEDLRASTGSAWSRAMRWMGLSGEKEDA
ncbi:MAG: protein kinase [bacterium]|nr:protein kinase [bacterium]